MILSAACWKKTLFEKNAEFTSIFQTQCFYIGGGASMFMRTRALSFTLYMIRENPDDFANRG